MADSPDITDPAAAAQQSAIEAAHAYDAAHEEQAAERGTPGLSEDKQEKISFELTVRRSGLKNVKSSVVLRDLTGGAAVGGDGASLASLLAAAAPDLVREAAEALRQSE